MSKVTVNKGKTGNESGRSRSHVGYKHVGQSERVVSLIAGTTLASSAMRSRSIMSAAILLGVSAGLIHRGATGRCGFSKGVDKLNRMLNNVSSELASRTESRGNRNHDEVEEASEESFPASDSPSFTPVTGESTHMNM